MNGAPGPYGQPNPWQEHKTPEGRVYYYNPLTKVTQWTKPEDMMTPAEVRIPNMVDGVFPFCDELRILTNLASTTARPRQPTMERIHSRRWQEVLVQHRDEAEFLGDARGLQNRHRSGCHTWVSIKYKRIF